MPKREKITVEVVVNALLGSAWKAFTEPDSIIAWNFASSDWCCPRAVNDLRKNGLFNYRMESKDGSMGFDFSGKYTEIVNGKTIQYQLGDEREVVVEFINDNGKTRVVETFDAEKENSIELQRNGWQAILNNYKKLVEGK